MSQGAAGRAPRGCAPGADRPDRPDRPVPRLHAIAADEVLDRRGFAEDARALLDWGGADLALHLRAHGRPGGALFALAGRLAPAAREAGALLVVNDRLDVALAAELDAVQLGMRSLPLVRARAIVPAGTLLGYSAHAAVEAASAAADGADWVLLGTIYQTASHPGRPGAGPGLVAETGAAVAAGPVPCPLIAIGGITPERAEAVLAAGAYGVAVLRGIWSAPVPWRAAVAFRAALAAGSVRGSELSAAVHERRAVAHEERPTGPGADAGEQGSMSTTPDTVRVTVNGRERELPGGLTITRALEQLGLTPRLVVVEHNRSILDRARYDEVEVRAGDNLEIVHFVGGG